MRSMFAWCLGCAVLVLVQARADAAFHLMQIEQVIAGVNGDVTAQAIMLRQRSFGQNIVSGTRIRAWDANGLNPVTVHTFVGNVANPAAGSRILVCTSAFIAQTTPACVPDGIMSTPIPASYLAAGRLTFEDSFGTIYWSLAWGGANYVGPNNGTTNDMNGNYGPPYPFPLHPLTTGGAAALQFQGPFTAFSTSNDVDYLPTAGPAVFFNNAGTMFTVNSAPATGRCCTPDENCQVLTLADCTLAGGTWTEAAACAPGVCEAGGQVGACCNGQVCTITTRALCEADGHVFEGSAACTVDGANNFVACCRANFDGVGGVQVTDIFAFLAAWFAGDSSSDIDGVGGVQVADIFAFLSLWFAGCS
ncbi:MAG: hypothetical protein KF699_07750 [Phycisphaeraceae bacterium]|nr:hypothetical protein [Phycisphaeraceae bacterium]